MARPPRWEDARWDSWTAALARVQGPSTCPVRSIEDHPLGAWIVQVLVDARSVERGYLLRAGGLEDQPARWWEAVHLVIAEVARCDAEAAEEAAR